MAKTLPYFRWYPADADTDSNFRAMDDSDIGFYVRCLNHAWVNGGLPADPKERARVMRTRLDTANKRWERVGKCWVTSEADNTILVNPRQESERRLASQKSQAAMESVKHRYERSTNVGTRALARADSGSDSSSLASSGGTGGAEVSALPPESKAVIVLQRANGAAPPRQPAKRYPLDDWSDRLYARHPKKKDLALVQLALLTALERVPDAHGLFAEIDRVHALWCGTFAWKQDSGRFCPPLARWIDDRGWTAEPQPTVSEDEYKFMEYERKNGKVYD